MPAKFVDAEEAVSVIKSRDTVFVHGAAMTPTLLLDALISRHHELQGVEIIHMHTEGKAVYGTNTYKKAFHVNSFFVANNLRKSVNEENADYVPVFLSEIHLLFKKNILRPDVAL